MESKVMIFMLRGNDKSEMLKKAFAAQQEICQFKLHIIYADKLNIPVYEQFGVNQLPTTIVVDEEDKVLSRYVGADLINSVSLFLDKNVR